jgi:hypothetical protein
MIWASAVSLMQCDLLNAPGDCKMDVFGGIPAICSQFCELWSSFMHRSGLLGDKPKNLTHTFVDLASVHSTCAARQLDQSHIAHAGPAPKYAQWPARADPR